MSGLLNWSQAFPSLLPAPIVIFSLDQQQIKYHLNSFSNHLIIKRVCWKRCKLVFIHKRIFPSNGAKSWRGFPASQSLAQQKNYRSDWLNIDDKFEHEECKRFFISLQDEGVRSIRDIWQKYGQRTRIAKKRQLPQQFLTMIKGLHVSTLLSAKPTRRYFELP